MGMKIDLHCHTKYSLDNVFDPVQLIREAYEKGLDGVCITDHFSVEASRPVDKIKKPEGFLVFRGVEISTTLGHMLAFGLRDDAWNIWGRYLHLDTHEVAASFRSKGGICVPSHPYRPVESMAELAFDRSLFDAVEAVNGANLPEWNERAVEKAGIMGMPCIGGSDCQGPGKVGRAYTVFDNPVATLADLVEEIRQGRCRPEKP
jgi:predicted metal-dependent phosphoesterase TrpH